MTVCFSNRTSAWKGTGAGLSTLCPALTSQMPVPSLPPGEQPRNSVVSNRSAGRYHHPNLTMCHRSQGWGHVSGFEVPCKIR